MLYPFQLRFEKDYWRQSRCGGESKGLDQLDNLFADSVSCRHIAGVFHFAKYIFFFEGSLKEIKSMPNMNMKTIPYCTYSLAIVPQIYSYFHCYIMPIVKYCYSNHI